MTGKPAILLFAGDHAMLSSLEFSLGIEGFEVADGTAGGLRPPAVSALVVDQAFGEDGLAVIAGLRAAGCGAPAILLATHPTARMRERAADAGAVLVEKPLLGDDLTRALRAVLITREAA